MSLSLRRSAALLAAGLIAAAAPLVVVAGPADAADDGPCLHEVQGTIFDPGCDDVTPPETDAITMTPAPNAAGYINVTQARFDFAGHYTDADADPIGFQCQYWNTALAPDPVNGTWSDCEKATVKSGFTDSQETSYHLRVRAVDTADNATMWSNGNALDPQSEQVPDYDMSYQQMDWRVDTTAPNTFISGEPSEDIRPDDPMADTNSPQLVLRSNEGSVTMVCALNGKSVPCALGVTTLKNLTPGEKVFSAYAVDVAGNADPQPSTVKFAVPKNLTVGTNKGWKTYKSDAYFAGDYLESRKVGSQITTTGQNVRELRLLAPAGPNLGKVEVKIGRSHWFPVNLYSPDSQKFKIYEVRDQYEPLTSGKITIRVKSIKPNRPLVRIDAILARS